MNKKNKSLTIVHGFLGSGKTTFLNHYMTQILKKDEKVALIVNEFGEFDVDSHLLSGYHVQRTSLQGCICCDMQNDLIAHLYQLSRDETLHHIIVEATGIANPIDILVACQDPLIAGVLSSIDTIGVIDSIRFLNRQQYSASTRRLMEDQIRASHTLFINKVDLIRSEEALDKVIEEVHTLAPHASIALSKYGQLTQKVKEGASAQSPTFTQSHAHAHYTSLKYTFNGAVAQENFARFILNLSDNVLRLKGYIQFREQPNDMFLVQYAEGLPTVENIGSDVSLPTTIVIVGEHLDKAMLRNQLDMLQFT
ncbi:CobW family GTP-binding protein [Staphylococcus lutrae]|uniref:GTP-binding protein n=1 Tax=Staphylococcus lutrae TaxID=155085 RepID=A0AAC9WJM7_9STAP|nr:GTP-binding protein [Staphylococcus lutrae]ARJ51228.1 GTP-binding protein [Staphylococcus lutrae]PNZ39473.1 GTP-binding protein [Staphylococcus lutrae]